MVFEAFPFIIGMIMVVWIVSVIVSCVDNFSAKPQYLGRCYQETDKESWEKPEQIRIITVGNSNYNVAFFWPDGTLHTKTMSAETIHRRKGIECPAGLK